MLADGLKGKMPCLDFSGKIVVLNILLSQKACDIVAGERNWQGNTNKFSGLQDVASSMGGAILFGKCALGKHDFLNRMCLGTQFKA